MILEGYCAREFVFEAETPIAVQASRPSFLDVKRPGQEPRRYVVDPGEVLELIAEPGQVTLWLGNGARAVIGEEVPR